MIKYWYYAITGVTSGIGLEIAKVLDSLGYEIIGVSKDELKLKEIQKKYGYDTYKVDLSNRNEVLSFCNYIKDIDIDVFINNAGFGDVGYFNETLLEKELSMIDVNIVANHILLKYIVKNMINNNSGYILNVSSSASFMAGPYMATYYSTKAYVTRMSEAIYEELRRLGKNVHISVLCPGPVNTNFNNVANVKFSLRGLSSEYVAKYSVDKMLKGKRTIIPGFSIKALAFISKFSPTNIVLYMTYKRQKAKEK